MLVEEKQQENQLKEKHLRKLNDQIEELNQNNLLSEKELQEEIQQMKADALE